MFNIGQRVALLWGEVDMVATVMGGRNQKAEYIVQGVPFFFAAFSMGTPEEVAWRLFVVLVL